MKLGKILKRSLIGLFVFLIVLIGAAIAIPFIFKDKIVLTVKQEINSRLNAEVDFDKDISLSLFRSFPDLSVTVNDLSVVGKEPFKGLRLASIKALDVNLDIMSVINGSQIEVNSFALDEANIYVKVLQDGRANYDIMLPTEEVEPATSESADYQIKLESYSISNSKIVYDDEAGAIYAEIVDLDHEGSGDFTATIYDLATETNIEALTINYGGVSYISEAKADLDLTIKIDMDKARYEFKENDITLNALKLETDGFVEMPGDDIKMDLNFKAPQTEFKYLLSMIPAAFTADFKNVDASGKMAFNGAVKGTLTDKSYPAVNLNLSVDNGTFKYPDLPLGVSEINTKVTVKSPEGSNLDRLTVSIPTFHMKMGKNPFDAVFMLKTPISDPDIKAKVNGIINLDELSKAIPLEGVEKLNGLINANIDLDTRLSFIEKEQYERVDIKGDLSIKNMEYVADDSPPIKIIDLQMGFSPQFVNLTSCFIKAGKSDIKANGKLENLLAYFSDDMTMKGQLDVRSTLLDANEWLSDEVAEDDPTENYEPEPGSTKLFDRFNFSLNADLKKVVYDTYTLTNTGAKGTFTAKTFLLTDFHTQIGESDINVSGRLDEVFGYLFENQTIKGDIVVASNNFNANQFISSEETATSETSKTATTESTASSSEGFERFDLNLDGNFKKIKYEDYTLVNTVAKGNFTPSTFTLVNFGTKIAESDVKINGRIDNVAGYLFDNKTLKGTINVVSNNFNLNQFAVEETETTETTTTEEVASVVPVPENMDMNVTADINRLLYDNMEFRQMIGALAVKDQRMTIDKFRGKSLGGSFGLTGFYDTKDINNPIFKFNFNLDKLKFQDSFKTLNSVKQIAPIAEFIEGLFSTELVLEGKLLKDMSLDYNSLTGTGFVTTLNAIIRDFKPLTEISKKMNLKELNEVKISDTKNWIELKDGQLVFLPADYKIKDIDMNVGGSHSIVNEGMDYKLGFKVPRELLEKSGVGAAANAGMTLLGQQAGKLGVNMAQGDNINFQVGLKGSMKKPKIDIKLIGTSGKSVKEEVKDQVKDVAEQKFEEAKDEVKTVVDTKVEETKAVVKEEVDKVVDKAKEELKDKVGQEAKDKAAEAADKLKDNLDEDTKKKLEDLKNKFPWKKKKGGGE